MKNINYNKYVKQAQEFWGKVASDNGWKLYNRGFTIWINKDNEVIDSIYNEKNNKESYIVQVELDWEGFYENEKLIKTINHYEKI